MPTKTERSVVAWPNIEMRFDVCYYNIVSHLMHETLCGGTVLMSLYPHLTASQNCHCFVPPTPPRRVFVFNYD